jgi:hypothetical protein
MNAGIGAAGSDKMNFLLENFLQNLLYAFLDSRLVTPLPNGRGL